MSDIAKVEDAEAPKVEGEDGTDVQAIWTELGDKEAGPAEKPPAADAPKEEGAEASQEEAPAPEPPAPQESDPWKDAPPELREAHEKAIEAERTGRVAAETLARRHSGRLSQANLQLNDLRAKLAPNKGGEAAPEGETAEARDERHKRLKEEYGDSAGELLPDIIRLETEIASLKSAQASQADAQTEDMLQQQLGVLEEAHPDWNTVTRDPANPAKPNPAFVAWKDKQPGYIQEAIGRNAEVIVDGASAADILDRFKRDTAPAEDPEKARIAAKRAEQMEAGQDTKIKAPAATKTGASDKDTQGLWDEFEAKDRRAAGRGG